MKKKVLELFLSILSDDYPELLIDLMIKELLQDYIDSCWHSVELLATNMDLSGTPSYIIESVCLENLVAELPPSKFRLTKRILMRDFYPASLALDMKGLLRYEVMNLITYCSEVFKDFPFDNNTEDSPLLEYYVTGVIAEHLSYKPSLN